MEKRTGRNLIRNNLNFKNKSNNMKKLLFLFSLSAFVLATSCNNSADTAATEEDSIEIEPETYMWQASMNDSTGKLEMKRDRPAGLDSLAPGPVIDFLNQTNPNIKLVYSKTSNDTCYVSIPDAHYLTQQMGSTGPVHYTASVVYNITEIPGINFVNFDFEEGDHAGPGVWSRKDFEGR
jgi:hypothetical protein